MKEALVGIEILASKKELFMKKTKVAGISPAIALFLMALAMGCETPTDSEEPYTLHFTQGTYEASAIGFNSQTLITVEVTFSTDAIESIDIVSHDETSSREGVQTTLDIVPDEIVRQQTLNPDAISGATASFTKSGIFKAVENCVKQAGGDKAVAKLKEGGIAQSIAILF
jgi:fumarate reductase flavoprotein subunit